MSRGGKRSPSRPSNPSSARLQRSAIPFVCIGLVALVWIVFGQTLAFPFINYDDNFYVYNEPAISRGLTSNGLLLAWTRPLVGNWHPLTSLSLMLDAQWFGLHPGGYHFSNVLLHTVAVLLLFLLFRRMTGRIWPSAFVAALFAIHPLRVESVAWVSERKDVLSGVLFMLTLLTYLHYVRSPSLVRYVLVIGTFALGLMAKAMLVTVPFVLLLLDYWPLRRWSNGSRNRLLLEKIPFLILVACDCAATIWAQEKALGWSWPFSWRINNALISIWIYLRQMLWPTDLGLFYPHLQRNIPTWQPIVSAVALLALFIALVKLRKRAPYLVTGWLWYLGMLIPVIGLIQVGLQSHADRYTYLPQIGLYLSLSWGLADLTKSWRTQSVVLGSAAGLVLVPLAALSWQQTTYWSSTEQIWRHTIAVTRDNYVAERGLGLAMLDRGAVEEAIAHERTALRLHPGDTDIETNLGKALLRKGEVAEAILHYRAVTRTRPNDNEAHRNLGKALLQGGATDEAVLEFRRALQLQPRDADAAYSLGNALLQKGALDDAIAAYRTATQVQPDNFAAHYNLAIALQRNRQLPEAVAEFQTTVRLQPNNVDARQNLGIALAATGRYQDALEQWEKILQRQPDRLATEITLAWTFATAPVREARNGEKALALAKRALQNSGGNELMLYRVLAAAWAENGNFDQAIATARDGIRRANESGNTSLVRQLAGDAALYGERAPLREGRPPTGSPSQR